jgi:hypothetical protein
VQDESLPRVAQSAEGRKRISASTGIGHEAAVGVSRAARHDVTEKPEKRKRAVHGRTIVQSKRTARALPKQLVITDRTEVIKYTKILIIALEEVLEFDPRRGHNQPPPALWKDDPSYLGDVGSILSELRHLNSLLEAKRPRKKEAGRAVVDLRRHFDKFLQAARGAARGGAVKLEPHICSREQAPERGLWHHKKPLAS